MTAPPAPGMLAERLTKFVAPFSLLIVAPPATGLDGSHADAGAPPVVATADQYGIFPLPVVPVNDSLLVVVKVESSHDSKVGIADSA